MDTVGSIVRWPGFTEDRASHSGNLLSCRGSKRGVSGVVLGLNQSRVSPGILYSHHRSLSVAAAGFSCLSKTCSFPSVSLLFSFLQRAPLALYIDKEQLCELVKAKNVDKRRWNSTVIGWHRQHTAGFFSATSDGLSLPGSDGVAEEFLASRLWLSLHVSNSLFILLQ